MNFLRLFNRITIPRYFRLPLLSMVACVLLGTFTGTSAIAANKEYAIGPVPSWVKHIDFDDASATPVAQMSQGVHYLLADSQTRAEVNGKTSFHHYAMQAVNEKGVENVSHISLSFDPTYQALMLHSILVHRDGRALSKLERANIRVLQREKELEYLVYDGSKTADIFLEDVRPGDIVEYAYTIRGNNPVFNNRLFGRFDLQWSVPVNLLYARLLFPRNRELYLKANNTKITAEASENAQYREYQWRITDQTALTIESNAPGWYDPYPSVDWGEFKDWQAVAMWAQPLYQVPSRLDAGLQKEVTRIAKVVDEPGDRLRLALRFVQGEIRYLGIEAGANSHAPTAPAIVAERRFGDCKDKALLTVTMLRALGIEAYPALVNTASTRGIREMQASPAAFNHVIVRATLDGKDYWIDPTLPTQEGDLEHLYQPDYGYALVVDAKSGALTAMPADLASSVNRRNIHAVFDASKGLDEPALYTITTRHEGRSAEVIRATLANQNREELQKSYLNFYAHYYPGITLVSPFSVEEGKTSNYLSVTERYSIPEFWKHVKKNKRHEAYIEAPDMEEYLKAPGDTVRHSPLGTIHPLDLTHTTEILLPEDWGVKNSHASVKNAAFEFERRISEDGTHLFLADHLQSRADHVDPADIPKYVADLKRARDELGYEIYQNDTAPQDTAGAMAKFNWPVALIAIVFFWIWFGMAALYYRYDPPHSAAAPDPGLHGISGWLVLPALGVIINPFWLIMNSVQGLSTYSTDTWKALTTAGSELYHPMWAPALLIDLNFNILQFIFSILLLVLFFQKRRNVPYLYIGTLIAAILIDAMEIFLVGAIPGEHHEVASQGIGGIFADMLRLCVWGGYFMFSQRVKSTFVRTWKAQVNSSDAGNGSLASSEQ